MASVLSVSKRWTLTLLAVWPCGRVAVDRRPLRWWWGLQDGRALLPLGVNRSHADFAHRSCASPVELWDRPGEAQSGQQPLQVARRASSPDTTSDNAGAGATPASPAAPSSARRTGAVGDHQLRGHVGNVLRPGGVTRWGVAWGCLGLLGRACWVRVGGSRCFWLCGRARALSGESNAMRPSSMTAM
jgi:hypothetical protein